MANRRHTPEQIIAILQQIELAAANGKSMTQICEEAGIVQQTYDRWQREYDGLQVSQASRLKQLEEENARLRCMIGELSVKKQTLSASCPETGTASPCSSSCVQCAASRSPLLWPETR